MAKKEKGNTLKVAIDQSSKASESGIKKTDLAILLLYLGVDLIPKLGSIEVMGPQWLYLSILNLISTIYIFTRFKGTLNGILQKLSKNILSLIYLSVFVLCGLSIFFALNPIESLVVYSRLIVTVIAFLNISILIYQRPKHIEFLFQAVSIIAIFQCIPLLYTYLKLVNVSSTDALILSLKANSGNKNVMAASFIIKTPIIIYCVFKYYSLGRYIINLISLSLVVIMIFVLNARAAYLAFFLQIIIYLIFLFINNKQNGIKQTIRQSLNILLPVLFGLIVSQILLIIPNSNSGYTTLDKRLATIAEESNSSSSARLYFWNNAMELIKEKPLTGIGYGNYKIESIKFQNGYFNDFDYAKHAHNDFLQITAEAGILTGFLFISIFLIAFIYTLKTWRSDLTSEMKMLNVISLMSLAGYFVDAIFNFPAERPVMQIFFAFMLAINAVIFMDTRKSATERSFSSNFSPLILLVSSTLTLISVYICLQTYKSMRVQVLTHYNFGIVQPEVSYLDVNSKFPAIPNLAENNIPINDTKAWYLYRAQKYDEALLFLNQDKDASPYLMSKELLKAAVYSDQGLIDSAHYYSKKGFFTRPRNMALFQLVTTTSVQLRDTSTIQKAFNEFRKYRNDPKAWKIYLKSLMLAGYNMKKLLSISDSIAKVYPKESEIQHARFSIRAASSANNNNYPEALNYLLEIMKLYPNDIENFENIGLTYYNLKDYANAEIYLRKVTEAGVYSNGKSEFFLGISLIQLGRKDEACTFLNQAVKRNYPQASLILNNNNCQVKD
ncbi:O-antigen ligase [Daejeonella rubra]|uniref:O-antigen ligase n=1 Tax=Daejeonella rubra TaxID=990371 RepID=A0A1G9XXF2_9SPHI|nr:O-antigen ligase family protein [Daejeonella rubra]SDN00933.1 O-antigen ligase [Daejeonella rubra]